MADIDDHRAVQAVAKRVLADLAGTVSPEDTELSIARRAVAMLSDFGIRETWYYDCPAFVLLGSRSCLSISGRDYRPSDEAVGATNLVTVDLSPSRDGIWGDCARSFAVENGRCTPHPSLPEFAEGIEFERTLHEAMIDFVKPETRFRDLFEFAGAKVAAAGFESADFLGNFGHTIESARDARRYIDKRCEVRFGEVSLFTFEPHLRKVGGVWGFKHENIYYLDADGKPVEL